MEPIAAAVERNKLIARKNMPKRVEKSSGFKIAFHRCESPIEQAFCLALFQVPDIYAIEGDYRPALAAHQPKKRGVLVFAQNPIKRYRADFLLVAFSPTQAEPAFLIVECDGAAFHTGYEKIDRDRRRERELRGSTVRPFTVEPIAAAVRIVRHTGSAIRKSPAKVIDETLACLSTHGWGKEEGQAWVSDGNIYRAIAQFPGNRPEDNPMMGYRPPELKQARAAIGWALDTLEAKWKAAARRESIAKALWETGDTP